MIKAIIIEDEYGMAKELSNRIAEISGNAVFVEVLPNLKMAKKWFSQHAQPDIVFMDIQLTVEANLEIFEYLKVTCPVVFTTAYEYALCAFKVRTESYPDKQLPDAQRRALSRSYNVLNGLNNLPADLSQLILSLDKSRTPASPYKEKFIVNIRNNWIPVDTKDIACFIRDNLNYLYTFSGEKYILDYTTLEDVEVLLDPKMFYRANRQSIIHIDAIQSVKPHENKKLSVLVKPPLKMEIDISREKAPAFKKWFDR